jgi:glyoxylase I family protein
MIRMTGIDHVVLRVRDLAKMQRFYVDVLGCTLERDEPDIGLYQLRAGSALIDLVPVDSVLGRQGGEPPTAEGRHNVDHVCVRVEPFDGMGILAYLAAHGVTAGPIALRYGAEGRGPSIYVQDPEGNTIELKGPVNLVT